MDIKLFIYLVFRIDFYSEQNDFQSGRNGSGRTGFREKQSQLNNDQLSCVTYKLWTLDYN